MKRWLTVSFWTLSVVAGAALAAPETSIRPQPRVLPGPQEWVPRAVSVPVYYQADIRPRPRPDTAAETSLPMPEDTGQAAVLDVAGSAVIRAPRPRPRLLDPGVPQPETMAATARAVGTSPRPLARPKSLRTRTSTAVARQDPAPVTKAISSKGKVCGDRAIRGTSVAPISGKLPGCGLRNAVRVTSVDGVALSTPATVDCDTARALKQWVRDGVKPVVGRLGGGVESISVIASYSCRTRNSRPGARVSEHGKGKAVDVAAVNLKNGVSLKVLKGWKDPVKGKLLKRMHKSACGPFGTVLGPDSDRYHQDHFHFDTANHRSGPYCR